MEDSAIVNLFFDRSQQAVTEAAEKYGKYCHSIAYNILGSYEDSEECVNDTYLKAWESMPPNRPVVLKTYLGKLTRNLALNRYEYLTAEKRGGGQTVLVIDELKQVLGEDGNPAYSFDGEPLRKVINDFLAGLKTEQRKIFMRRYWYLSSVKEIAREYGISESKVKMSLSRSRKALKKALEKEALNDG